MRLTARLRADSEVAAWPETASPTAASTVACHVLRSFALTSWPKSSRRQLFMSPLSSSRQSPRSRWASSRRSGGRLRRSAQITVRTGAAGPRASVPCPFRRVLEHQPVLRAVNVVALQCHQVVAAVLLRVAVTADAEQAHIKQGKGRCQHPLPGQCPARKLGAGDLEGCRKAARYRQDVVVLLPVSSPSPGGVVKVS